MQLCHAKAHRTKNQQLIIQIKNVPRVESKTYNSFPFLPFCDYGFKKFSHSARDKTILKFNNERKYDLPITYQRNGLDNINVSFIKLDTTIPTSFRMVHMNDNLATHGILLHASP